MTRDTIRIIQTRLKELGFYKGKIDGLRGSKTHAAAQKALAKEATRLADNWKTWSGRRMTIAVLQLHADAEGIDAGTIDGLWGPQTDFAADALAEKLQTGSVQNFVDQGPFDLKNPHGFPDELRDQKAIVSFFGKAGRNGGHRPPLAKVSLPWQMKLSWQKRSTRSFLWVHEKAAVSLKNVLDRIDGAYSNAQLSELGADLFGGDYNPRIMRGAGRPSLHSWGIAFDFDPDRNRLRANGSEARLGQPDAIPFWEAWEAEGWCSLGRVRNYDFMHVQAANRAY